MFLITTNCAYHRPVSFASGGCHRLRRPSRWTWFRRILGWIPLHSPEKRGKALVLSRRGPEQSHTHLTWAEALLLIVRFSASDANELSKSPVSTFPVAAAGCEAGDAFCALPVAEPRTLPVWVTGTPELDDAPEPLPEGLKTSPNASKPFIRFVMHTDPRTIRSSPELISVCYIRNLRFVRLFPVLVEARCLQRYYCLLLMFVRFEFFGC